MAKKGIKFSEEHKRNISLGKRGKRYKTWRGPCEHGRRRSQCVDCGDIRWVCKHNKLRRSCKDCGGNQICTYNRFRSKCAECSPKGTYKDYINGANKRNLSFSLTFEEFVQISHLPCNYCGDAKAVNGLDRKDNLRGYTFENSAPCCSKCNIMKNKHTIEEFLKHVKRIFEFSTQKGETS